MVRRPLSLLGCFALFMLSACSSDLVSEMDVNLSTQAINWFNRTPYPDQIFEAQGISIGVGTDARTYVFGGFYDFRTLASGRTLIPSTRSSRYYNAVSQGTPDRWVDIAPMPILDADVPYSGVTHAGIARQGNKIHLVGGFVGDFGDPNGNFYATSEVLTYDIGSNSWSTSLIPNLPEPRAGGGLINISRNGVNELHFMGGVPAPNPSGDIDQSEHWVMTLNSAGDNTSGWVSAPAMPNPRNHFGIAYSAPGSAGSIYVIGGQKGYADTSTTGERNGVLTDVRRYDIAARTWYNVDALPFQVGHISYSTVTWGNSNIYVFGGSGNNRVDLNSVLVYDPLSTNWRRESNLLGSRSAGVAGLGRGSSKGAFIFTTGRSDGNCGAPKPSICDETFQGNVP